MQTLRILEAQPPLPRPARNHGLKVAVGTLALVMVWALIGLLVAWLIGVFPPSTRVQAHGEHHHRRVATAPSSSGTTSPTVPATTSTVAAPTTTGPAGGTGNTGAGGGTGGGGGGSGGSGSGGGGGGSTAWSAPVVIDPMAASEETTTLTSIACPTTSFCMAVGFGGDAVEYSGGAWTAPVHLGPGAPGTLVTQSEFTAVSCSSPSFCMALTTAGYTYAFDGSRWRGPLDTSPYYLGNNTAGVFKKALSCPADNWCVTMNRYGNSFIYSCFSYGCTWNRWYIAPLYGVDMGVACAVKGVCEATDNNGYATSMIPTGWATPRVALGITGVNSLTCISDGDCLGSAGTQSISYSYSAKQWQAPVPIGASPVVSVSCAADNFCMGIGGETPNPATTIAYTATFDGQSWSEVTGPSFGDGVAVSCPTSSFCVAISRAEASIYQP